MDLLKFYKTHLFSVCVPTLKEESNGEKWTMRLFLPCDKCRFNIHSPFWSVVVTETREPGSVPLSLLLLFLSLACQNVSDGKGGLAPQVDLLP